METLTKNQEYIIPTKEAPVFTAECDYFGYIEREVYKDHLCGNCCSTTFAIDFTDAIVELHKWIKDNKDHLLKEFPKAKYNIYAIDGSLDKHGEKIMKLVYTITPSKIKKYLTR